MHACSSCVFLWFLVFPIGILFCSIFHGFYLLIVFMSDNYHIMCLYFFSCRVQPTSFRSLVVCLIRAVKRFRFVGAGALASASRLVTNSTQAFSTREQGEGDANVPPHLIPNPHPTRKEGLSHRYH